jgi:pyruvate/2-oxoglutarate dehydrogenase complex dihydrolipoamide dehydrogenase (E3) component
VSLLHTGSRLVDKEDPHVGEVLAQVLRDAGVALQFGAEASRAMPVGEGARLLLKGGASYTA